MLKKIEKTKWELKRDRLMQSETYRHIIRMIGGDAEMLHRINLSLSVEKTNSGEKYSLLLPAKCVRARDSFILRTLNQMLTKLQNLYRIIA
jgi:hypothetical protein